MSGVLIRKIVPAIVIGAVTVSVSAAGGAITQGGMGWYRTINLPGFTPPGSVIGMVWTVIYIMAGIAAYLICTTPRRDRKFMWLNWLLAANAVLNTMWTWLFFGIHWIGLSILEMILLNVSNMAVILLCWKHQRTASLLFVPYFAWVCFATYLAYSVWQLNR